MAVQNERLVHPVRIEDAPPDIRAVFVDIQDTLGIPWVPLTWRVYANSRDFMKLIWVRIKPALSTDLFLRDALAIAGRAYLDASSWYRPDYKARLPKGDIQTIQWELDAFEFGNPQILIQQAALGKLLEGHSVGKDNMAIPRRQPSPFRHPDIVLVDEDVADPDMSRIYQDIKSTLGLPLVNSDYQALAKWPEFFKSAWPNIKSWRLRPEYRNLRSEIILMAGDAIERLRPEITIESGEIEGVLSQHEKDEILSGVRLFSHLIPGLIVNNALFRIAAASDQFVGFSNPGSP